MKKIALIYAMHSEASPTISRLDLKPVEKKLRLPFQYFEGNYKGIEVVLGLNGKDPRYGNENIGTEPATVNAQNLISTWGPDLLINVGTAGGFKKKGGSVGDIYLSEGMFYYHDREVSLPIYDKYIIGEYPSFEIPKLAESLGLKRGQVSSGNSLEITTREMDFVTKNNIVAKEMEATAIAWVAWLNQTPFIALKGISDLVDDPEPVSHQFMKNLEMVSAKLSQKTLEVLDFLAN